MTNIVIFGAGGRAGRAAIAESLRRGHTVTAVVRDPAKHPDLETVAGDVTDPAGVAEVSRGHDVAISSVADLTADPRAASSSRPRELSAVPASTGWSWLASRCSWRPHPACG